MTLENRASEITDSEYETLKQKADDLTINEDEFILYYYLWMKKEENVIIKEKEAIEQYRSYKIEFGVR